MASNVKANLDLLKKLVSVLESSLEEAYDFRDSDSTEKTKDNYNEFVVKVSKASGMLVGIINESNLLASDLTKLITASALSFVDENSLFLKDDGEKRTIN